MLCAASACAAQVLAPPEIADPALRALQQEHFDELKAAAIEITSHTYPYKFYLSRRLDLNESKQQRADQRSIRFATFHQQTVVQITGNYFAAYAADRLTEAERAKQTYVDVMLPIIKAVSPRIQNEKKVDAIAIEVSHHTRRKVFGLPMENAENITLIVPRATAGKIAADKDPDDQIAQLSNAQLFVDGRPLMLWPDNIPARSQDRDVDASHPVPAAQQAASPEVASRQIPSSPEAEYNRAKPLAAPAIAEQPSSEDLSSTALASRQSAIQETLNRMVRDLDAQAHFIAYAPPALIAFHNASFLQLSLTANLPPEETGSQYRLAALAFDKHVSHLIRPVLACLRPAPDFFGIVFSTSVRVGDVEGSAQSVEFFFPLERLRRYDTYDLTGQQLIDSGFVLINGERVELNLQNAEATSKVERGAGRSGEGLTRPS